jgi:tRNA pseudouridine55 synthase
MSSFSNDLAPDGVLVIDKPAGPTSHDIVAMVRRLTGARKVGHLGTLDPAASGVLPLVLNGATKLAATLAGVEKVYEFTLVLGRATDTDDDAGRAIAEGPAPEAFFAELQALLPQFTGSILQRPPRYSAIKVGGERAYRLAREKGDVPLEPRPVTIDALEILRNDWPEVRMRLACRSGTYVRSLCRDLGEALSCGGHAKTIRRLQSGPYTLDMAVTMEALGSESGLWRQQLIPAKSPSLVKSL